MWPVSAFLTTTPRGCKQELEKRAAFITRAELNVGPSNSTKKKKDVREHGVGDNQIEWNVGGTLTII